MRSRTLFTAQLRDAPDNTRPATVKERAGLQMSRASATGRSPSGSHSPGAAGVRVTERPHHSSVGRTGAR